MVNISPDRWNGGYKVTGVEAAIAEAQRNAKHKADMDRISQSFADMPGEIARGTVRDMATIGLVGIGMARNKKFRYTVQALIHLPIAFMVSILAAIGINQGELSGAGFGWAVLATVVWTGLYIALRTVPKWRKLNREMRTPPRPQPAARPRFASGNNPY